jgi:hypothetical protein
MPLSYSLLSSPKISFLDDILTELEKELVAKNEAFIIEKVCYKFSKPDKIFGSFKKTKSFIPKNKEQLYFKIATLYLEREKLISIIQLNPEKPTYLINYEGIVLVKRGGLCKKLFLEKVSGWLQRLAWIIVFLTFLVNTLVELGYIQKSTVCTNENPPSVLEYKSIKKT